MGIENVEQLLNMCTDSEIDAFIAAMNLKCIPARALKARIAKKREHAPPPPPQNKICGEMQPEKHVLVSARFDGGPVEEFARSLHTWLRELGIPSYMVFAMGGGEFGRQTVYGLIAMCAMIAVCTAEYGAETDSAYSSYEEVKHAIENHIPIVPLKLVEAWPPAPRDSPAVGGGTHGAEQNKFAFSKSLLFVEGLQSDGLFKSPKECAELLKNHCHERQV